jgi:replicative DNA helicase
MGKTALSLNIALNIIKNSKLPVLFFSLEMSKEQIMYRLLSMETNINQMKLKNGKLSQNDWIKLNKIIKFCQNFLFLLMILLFIYSRYSIKNKNNSLNKIKLD